MKVVRYGTVRYGTERYGTVRYISVRYGTVITVFSVYSTVRYRYGESDRITKAEEGYSGKSA
jgi:hypothetical protein